MSTQNFQIFMGKDQQPITLSALATETKMSFDFLISKLNVWQNHKQSEESRNKPKIIQKKQKIKKRKKQERESRHDSDKNQNLLQMQSALIGFAIQTLQIHSKKISVQGSLGPRQLLDLLTNAQKEFVETVRLLTEIQNTKLKHGQGIGRIDLLGLFIEKINQHIPLIQQLLYPNTREFYNHPNLKNVFESLMKRTITPILLHLSKLTHENRKKELETKSNTEESNEQKESFEEGKKKKKKKNKKVKEQESHPKSEQEQIELLLSQFQQFVIDDSQRKQCPIDQQYLQRWKSKR